MHLVHRALGAHLARNSFIVAMPVHPGDNREDATAVGTPDNLSERPRHLRVLVDRLAADDRLGPYLPGTAFRTRKRTASRRGRGRARHAETVARGPPDAAPLEHHVIADAGDNSFLSPYPEEMTGPT